MSIKAGSILLAAPFSLLTQDKYLERSIILITEIDDEGVIGFVLNKESDMDVNTALTDFPKIKANIFEIGEGGVILLMSLGFFAVLQEFVTVFRVRPQGKDAGGKHGNQDSS